MPASAPQPALSIRWTPQGGIGARFLAFVVEQHPFAVDAARRAVAKTGTDDVAALKRVLAAHLEEVPGGTADLPETTPFTSAIDRMQQETARLLASVDAFFARAAIERSFSDDEKRAMLRGIILTRAVDNRMKHLFLSSEMKYGELGFQGKGFRSLGQEAIFAAATRLKKGPHGDVVGPLIRDLGVTLAFTDDVEMALNAQVGKAGAPSNGKDLHLGSPEHGVVMVAAPLSIATCTVTGYALAFHRRKEARVAFSFIGEGGSSLGEWHEAITLAAAMKLPCVFCVENNQTALSTPVTQQSRVRVFADKAAGYGIPCVSVDGTDPEAIAAAFAWAAERARNGDGPALIETIAMRMAGHAHHDDMLYLGADPPLSFSLPPTPDK
ncbi:MAG TPA: thiamine pyrophosphate-dependent enzyme, partial [Myxococcota bacterium]